MTKSIVSLHVDQIQIALQIAIEHMQAVLLIVHATKIVQMDAMVVRTLFVKVRVQRTSMFQWTRHVRIHPFEDITTSTTVSTTTQPFENKSVLVLRLGSKAIG